MELGFSILVDFESIALIPRNSSSAQPDKCKVQRDGRELEMGS